MPPLVVDTDGVSYLFRRDSRAEAYRSHLTGNLLVVSFMTVAELDRWTLERDWGDSRCQQMEEYLRNFVIYPYNRRMCRKWAEVMDGAAEKVARWEWRPVGSAPPRCSTKCRWRRTAGNTFPTSKISRSSPNLRELQTPGASKKLVASKPLSGSRRSITPANSRTGR